MLIVHLFPSTECAMRLSWMFLCRTLSHECEDKVNVSLTSLFSTNSQWLLNRKVLWRLCGSINYTYIHLYRHYLYVHVHLNLCSSGLIYALLSILLSTFFSALGLLLSAKFGPLALFAFIRAVSCQICAT